MVEAVTAQIKSTDHGSMFDNSFPINISRIAV